MCTNGGVNAIRCWHDFGPAFGAEKNRTKDVYMSSDSNTNQNSSSDFGYQYKQPDSPCGSDYATSILAGSYNFQTVEIEVFYDLSRFGTGTKVRNRLCIKYRYKKGIFLQL